MQTIVVHLDSKEKTNAIKAFLKALKIKFEVAEEAAYDPAFVAKIKKSEAEANKGELKSIKLDELWK